MALSKESRIRLIAPREAVTVFGKGNTDDEALQDALRSARSTATVFFHATETVDNLKS